MGYLSEKFDDMAVNTVSKLETEIDDAIYDLMRLIYSDIEERLLEIKQELDRCDDLDDIDYIKQLVDTLIKDLV